MLFKRKKKYYFGNTEIYPFRASKEDHSNDPFIVRKREQIIQFLRENDLPDGMENPFRNRPTEEKK
jgi:hypothetical protein